MPANGAQAHQPDAILATKLRRPVVSTVTIVRPQLLSRLDRGFPLAATLISAPAGYGKSVIASQWLDHIHAPSAWLSLDEAERDVSEFLRYVVAAIRTAHPETLTEIKRLVQAPMLPPLDTLATALLNDLERLPERTILVLDDYHTVACPEVDRMLTGVLRLPTPRLHLALLSRHDTGSSLMEVLAHGQVHELRAADLRFSPEEIGAFVEHEYHVRPSPELVEQLERKTEGWPAGLRLGLQAHRSRGDPTMLLESAAAPLDDAVVLRYLAEEVVAAQPEWLRQPLLAASITNRFCAPLCDAMLAPSTDDEASVGRDFIDWIEEHNLFCVPLDDRHEWYRFHHLFQDLLQQQLERTQGTDAVVTLHRRAAGWLDDHGSTDEALRHTLAAGDAHAAARIVARRGPGVLDDEGWSRLERWIDMLPRAIVDQDAELLALEAWVAEGLFRLRQMEGALARAQAVLQADDTDDATSRYVQGSLDTLRGYVAFNRGAAQSSLRLVERGIGNLPPEGRREHALATVLHIASLQATGDYPGAMAAAEATMLDPNQRSSHWAAWSWGMAHAGWLETDLRTVRLQGEALRTSGDRAGLLDMAAHGRYFVAFDRYQRDELAAVEPLLRPVVDDRYLVRPLAFLHSAALLACAHLALGRPDDAWALAELISRYATERSRPFLATTARAFEAELHLRQGHLGAAVEWVDWYRPVIRQYWMFYAPTITALKVLLAMDTPAARERASDLLGKQSAVAETMHNRSLRIPLLGLRALLSAQDNDEDTALRALGRAVSESQPSGAVRFLADLGPALVPLLNRLDVAGEELDHVGAILTAITGRAEATSEEGDEPVPTLPDALGPERLTAREISVLTLLARRYSNKEIARELIIAPATVKKHTIALYRKLHVTGRREAAAKAVALGYVAAHDQPEPTIT